MLKKKKRTLNLPQEFAFSSLFSPSILDLLEGSDWGGRAIAKRRDYCLNGNLFLALSQTRAILVAFHISKKSSNALRKPLSTKQLIIVNVGHA